jgi:CRISPR-associated endonuclease/helicase Cas3
MFNVPTWRYETIMLYHAHSGTLSDKSDWQPLSDHLFSVAELARRFAEPIGLQGHARIAGLLHDLGKYNALFQRRLSGDNIRIDHSTAGAWVLMQEAKGDRRVWAELIAYAILGHHAGLPDKHNEFGHCFERRIDEFKDQIDPVWKDEFPLDLSALDAPEVLKRIDRNHVGFDFALITRMLFSCLVDADYKDTEAFYDRLESRQSDREWPSLEDRLPEFLARFDSYMAAKPTDGAINALRAEILAHVRTGALQEPGLFTLNVPTGGGKTLASLGFALDHARSWGHRRIIYAIPFTSIVDQTAAIFRDVLGDENVLEHHSAIDEEKDQERAGCDKLKLAMEDWAAPVIVTTNVQFFESLFAARTSRARKLHNIAGSIIILDEAQTIPRPLLKPCVRMLDALARLCSCTIVLCTATQPALDASTFPGGLKLAGRELAPNPHRLAGQLKRARIVRVGPMDNQALIEAIGPEPQALVIVNSRRHALDLYNEAKAAGLEGLVHLTTRQCAAHRAQILRDVRARLRDGGACRLVATSLVEAGVDVDFPRVWRAEAGLDQIIQAAGRCNRDGRRAVEESIVAVFSAPDYPAPREIAGLIGDMERMAARHEDLQSLPAIADYFGEVYWRAGTALDAKRILKDFNVHPAGTDFSFRAASEKFQMIESGMESVIIPFDDVSWEAVHNLQYEQIPSGLVARKLQKYVVQVPPKARRMLVDSGHVAFACPKRRGDQFAVLQNGSFYRGDVGLLWEDAAYLAEESFMI